MARLTLRSVGDKADKKEHVVEPGGVTFGRDPNEADIVIADKSVSKRHARVFLHRGAWMLEDLGSSNGTFLAEERISGPVSLKARQRFSIAAFTYEVMSVDASGAPADDDGDDARSNPDMATATSLKVPEDDPPPAPRERSASARKSAAPPESSSRKSGARTTAPPPASAPTPDPEAPADEEAPPASAAAPASRAKVKAAKPAPKPRDDDDDVGDDPPPPVALEGDPKSPAFYLKAMPRAVAYHLVNIPLLVLNPPGTVRKSIEKMPLPELQWPGLIVYALPANLFSAAVTFVCTLIMQLISGTLSIGSIIPVVPLVVAVASSVVGGLICHPLLTWLVGKLKGESNARQRTNFFVLSMSAVAVTAIPSGLAILLSAVKLPFVGVLPVLLSLVGTALMTLVNYRWFTAFNVVKWFRMVLLALGVLAALGAAKSLVDVVVASVKSIGSSSGSSSSASADDAAEKAEAAAEKAKEKAEEKAEKAEEAAEKAEKAKAEKAAEKEKAEEEDGPRKGKKGKKGKAAKGDEKEEDDKEAAAATEKEKEKDADTAKEAAAEKEKEKEKDKEPAKEKASGSVDYGTYLEHRDAVEKALMQNPKLLKSVPGLLALYEKYHRAVYDIRSRKEGGGGKKKSAAPDPALEPVRQRLKDIEVYEKTSGLVEELHDKVK